MKIYSLKREQIIKSSLDQVFSFFNNPENLVRLTPKSLSFNIITPLPVKMRTGTLIDYTIKLAGISVRWTTLITAYDPPYLFIDEQLKGPYNYWHHTHTFEITTEGTLIRDEVRYIMPLGVIGQLVHALFIKRRLRLIFNYRKKAIEDFFYNNTDKKRGCR